MKKGIIGKKIGMTQIFDETGRVIPVTIVAAGPCVVAQKKTAEKDGYEAVQLGYADVKEKHAQKTADLFAEICPDADVNLICGGQPVYYYMISAE